MDLVANLRQMEVEMPKRIKSDRRSYDEHIAIINRINDEIHKPPTPQDLFRVFSEAQYVLEDLHDSPEARELAFKVTKFCKDWCLEQYEYADRDDAFYCLYEDILLWEARNRVLDSYLLYLEKNRPFEEKFYEPKRKCFLKIGLIQAMQDLIDDKLDVLSISLPPGTGKAQPLYSKVLTPNGFVKMGDIKVGDKVIAGNGKVTNVLGVYPQGVKEIYEITLEDGSRCRCCAEHLWNVRYNYFANKFCEKTIELKEMLNRPWAYLIPVFRSGKIFWLRVERIAKYRKEECQCIMVEDKCHLYITDDYIITHNTTLEKFFASAIIGWYPRDYSLFFSHSGDITRMFYDGMVDITTSLEYTWRDIFPRVKLLNTNAKTEQITFNNYKPFPNIQCTSIGSSNAGKVRANKFLYCDDLIGGIEVALNKNRLDNLWNIYSVDARQRKVPGAKEVHISTRWSVNDIIGRLQRLYEDDDRCRFIAVSDIDSQTGKSNFDYAINGFDEQFFTDQAMVMDEVSYRCLYKNEPIEREGLLYTDNAIRRYFNLPDGEPDEILAQCDPKGKGTDFMVMPVLYRYGNDYYCVDAVCNREADYEVQYQNLANLLVANNVQNCEFEANAGGDRVALEVNKRVEEMNWVCNITSKPTESNKEARIFQCANWVKQHILFKDKTLYDSRSDYGQMMSQLLSYSITGKNPNDDVPDCFANFTLRIKARESQVATVVLDRSFLGF